MAIRGHSTLRTYGSAELVSSLSSATIAAHNLNDGKFTDTYDAKGNWTSKTNNNVVTKSVAYQYDALGRRIGKSVDDNGNGTVDRRESYIYNGAGLLASAAGSIHISGPNGVMGQHGWVDQMVLSFIDADGDGSGAMTLATRNLYGDAVDQIFATESGSGDVFWALTDHQGTPRDWATRSASGTTTVEQKEQNKRCSRTKGAAEQKVQQNKRCSRTKGAIHPFDGSLLCC